MFKDYTRGLAAFPNQKTSKIPHVHAVVAAFAVAVALALARGSCS